MRSRSGESGLHVEILMNLATNVQHYPEWNAYLKNRQPKTLIVWGRNDLS